MFLYELISTFSTAYLNPHFKNIELILNLSWPVLVAEKVFRREANGDSKMISNDNLSGSCYNLFNKGLHLTTWLIRLDRRETLGLSALLRVSFRFCCCLEIVLSEQHVNYFSFFYLFVFQPKQSRIRKKSSSTSQKILPLVRQRLGPKEWV